MTVSKSEHSWYQDLVVEHSGDLFLILWGLGQELCVTIQGIEDYFFNCLYHR